MTMKRMAGFTLVELLAALFTMALMAALGWRALDGMARAQAQTDARAGQVMALQAGLAQWSADLDALAQLPQTPALEWDGRVLRITRRAMAANSDSLHVVAWTQRQGRWLRWQSPELGTRGEVAAAWQQAGAWSQDPGDEERSLEVAVTPLREWRLYYFRSDSWTHPLSSDGAAGAARTDIVPDGVRLVLVLPEGQALAGQIVRDWVSPRHVGARS
jgi:general secretion pathway protein J